MKDNKLTILTEMILKGKYSMDINYSLIENKIITLNCFIQPKEVK